SPSYAPPTPRHLPTFPTRRSSDLLDAGRRACCGEAACAGRARGGWSALLQQAHARGNQSSSGGPRRRVAAVPDGDLGRESFQGGDRKSTRLNSSHVKISYAVFCLK